MPTSHLLSGAPIDGVHFRPLTEHHDARGSFTEVYQDYWNERINPVQWSVVKSKAGVFRGMHLHLRHDEYFHLVSGRCLLALKDLRSGSPTNGTYSLYQLDSEDAHVIVFPVGLLHGWYSQTDTVHLQAVSEAYADYHADDNWGVRWDAEDLGIPWPFTRATVSQRAQDFVSEAELREALIAYRSAVAHAGATAATK